MSQRSIYDCGASANHIFIDYTRTNIVTVIKSVYTLGISIPSLN